MKRISIIVGNISKGAGTERAVTNLANMLSSDNYKVSIISLYSNDSHYFNLNTDITVFHLSIGQVSKFSYYKVISKTRKIIKQNKSNFVIGTTHAINSLLPLICIGMNVRTIGCEHMSYQAAPSFSRILRRVAYPYLSAVVTLTKADSQFYKFLKDRIYVIPNSLSFIPKEKSILNSNTIISVGRLTYQKGYDYLLEIILLLKDKIEGWTFKIFGEGELKDELLQKIKNDGLSEYIEICLPKKDIHKEYLDASLYVMTSRWEGLPMVLIEAASCGLPIISFDCPEGPRELVKNEFNGYLITDFNKEEFAKRILELCKDYKRRKEYGQNSIRISDKFSSNEILKMWVMLFENCKIYGNN